MAIYYEIKYTKLYIQNINGKKKEIITRKPGANNFDERNVTYGPNANENGEKERQGGEKEVRLILNNEE